MSNLALLATRHCAAYYKCFPCFLLCTLANKILLLLLLFFAAQRRPRTSNTPRRREENRIYLYTAVNLKQK